MTCHLINKHMGLCTYYLANLPVIRLKDRLAGIVKQNGGNLYMSIPPLFLAEQKSVA